MKITSIVVFLSVFCLGLFAQEFEVPQNYKLDKAEDYAPYENDVINCVTWLLNTPIDKETSKRKKANEFLLKWITGSPSVTVNIKAEIVTFMDSPDLFLIFLGGWTKYALETKDESDAAGSLAGIEAAIDLYLKNKGIIPKNKEVEKYIKMKKKGSLKDYVEKNA